MTTLLFTAVFQRILDRNAWAVQVEIKFFVTLSFSNAFVQYCFGQRNNFVPFHLSDCLS